jgi:hypothetical protein
MNAADILGLGSPRFASGDEFLRCNVDASFLEDNSWHAILKRRFCRPWGVPYQSHVL